jgi:acyl carrier protein
MEVDEKFDDKIMALIAGAVPGKFRKTKITRETHLQKQLGLDSIGVVALVFRFEELFSIDITQMGIEVDIAKIKTVADVLSVARDILSKASVAREA